MAMSPSAKVHKDDEEILEDLDPADRSMGTPPFGPGHAKRKQDTLPTTLE